METETQLVANWSKRMLIESRVLQSVQKRNMKKDFFKSEIVPVCTG